MSLMSDIMRTVERFSPLSCLRFVLLFIYAIYFVFYKNYVRKPMIDLLMAPLQGIGYCATRSR